MNRGTSNPYSRPAIILSGIFLCGILIGTLSWNWIALPFSNPWKITGPLTILEYNPSNNMVRFVVFILLPSVLLMLAYAFLSAGSRTALFRPLSVQEQDRKMPRWVFAFIVVFSVIIALNYSTLLSSGDFDTFHEGESLGTGISYAAGSAPYRDYLFAHGLYQDPLRSVIAFELFGRSIGSVRTLESLHKVLAIALLGIFMLKLYRNNYTFAFAALLLLTYSSAIHPLPSHFIIPAVIAPRDLMVFAFLSAVISLHESDRRHGDSRIKIAAASFAFSFIPVASFAYSIDRGFYLSAAFVILTPLLFYFFQLGRTKLFMASFLAGCVSAAVLVAYLLGDGAVEFFNFTFRKMPAYKELMDGLVYPFDTSSGFLLCALCAFNIFWLTTRFLGEWRQKRIGNFVRDYFPELAVLLVSIFIFRSALGRADRLHLAYNGYFIYVLFICIVLRHKLGPFIEGRRLEKVLSRIVAVFVIVFSIIGVNRIYQKELLSKNFPLHVKDDEFIPADYKASISFLEKNLAPGETFFTMTSEASWYYFLNRPAPTRFPIVWFAAPDFYQREVVQDLKKSDVKYIIYSNAGSSRIDNIANETRLPIIYGYIRENYKFSRRLDDHEIWIRKEKESIEAGSAGIETNNQTE